jgi:hypothetical protein
LTVAAASSVPAVQLVNPTAKDLNLVLQDVDLLLENLVCAVFPPVLGCDGLIAHQ